MRVIVYGAGAVGSVIGGRLQQAGVETVLVARPAHCDAIRAAGGLVLREGDERELIDVDAVTDLATLTPRDHDIVLITAKTQDVAPIHRAVAAWGRDVAVLCGTNGVEHERMALRRFHRVYGMVIQLPATFETPGVVTALCAPTNALIDVGRYPRGEDDVTRTFAAAADASPRLSCESDPDIMVKKYGKILLNLGNVTDAAAGTDGRFHPLVREAQAEAKAAYAAAGIRGDDGDGESAQRYRDRRAGLRFVLPSGDTFLGGSTWQGLAKGADSVETDYFNGEIALLGRLHGVATPVNVFLQELAYELMAERVPAGSLTPADIDARWQAWQSAH